MEIKSFPAFTYTIITSILVGTSFLLDFIYPLSQQTSKTKNTKNMNLILVHGHMSGTWIFYLLGKYLTKKGFNIYYPNYGKGTEDIDVAATKLHDYLESNFKNKSYTLIGSSIGCIVTLKYLIKYNAWDNVHKFISIAGPFKGTPLASKGIKFSPAAKQILPNSQFLTELLNESNINSKKVISIVSNKDNVVSAKSGTLPDSKQILTNALGHSDILYFSKEVWEHIYKEASS